MSNSDGVGLGQKPARNVNAVGCGSLPAHISARQVRARLQVALALVIPLSERQESDAEHARKLRSVLVGLSNLLKQEGYGSDTGTD